MNIIKCKDCQYFTKYTPWLCQTGNCIEWKAEVHTEEYCSRARKRDKNETFNRLGTNEVHR